MFVSNRYIVSIGSNFHPEQNVAKAQQLITTYFDEVHFVHCRWTLPVGDIYQSNFYNTAAAFSTPLSAEALKRQLKLFEAQIGRTPEQKPAGIVPIDLDIIACNGRIVHADYERFPFVKEAVDELLSMKNE